MKKIAIVYHSRQGNTEQLAKHVAFGVQESGSATALLLKAEDITAQPDRLLDFDGCIWGSPTYLGGVSGPFKSFMDATGGLWKQQKLKDKFACGFTVSALPSGDKQTTLVSMFTFSMQHGMIWVGNPFLPEQGQGVVHEEALNWLGSWTGLMAQAGHSVPGQSFVPGDLRSAEAFGQNFARVVSGVSSTIAEVA